MATDNKERDADGGGGVYLASQKVDNITGENEMAAFELFVFFGCKLTL
jgi:hypothetical protein